MIAYAGEDVEKGKHPSIAGRRTNLYSSFGNQYGEFSENWESIYFNTTLRYILKAHTFTPQRHLLNYAYSSIIHNSQNLETT